jgi:SUMO ligase MMS21 Smc5/6 complex component
MCGQVDSEFDEIICPITLKIMEDPVIAADGHTYERSAIQEWIDRATQGVPQS